MYQVRWASFLGFSSEIARFEIFPFLAWFRKNKEQREWQISFFTGWGSGFCWICRLISTIQQQQKSDNIYFFVLVWSIYTRRTVDSVCMFFFSRKKTKLRFFVGFFWLGFSFSFFLLFFTWFRPALKNKAKKWDCALSNFGLSVGWLVGLFVCLFVLIRNRKKEHGKTEKRKNGTVLWNPFFARGLSLLPLRISPSQRNIELRRILLPLDGDLRPPPAQNDRPAPSFPFSIALSLPAWPWYLPYVRCKFALILKLT